ncbi:mid region of cactin-domain-containing protein [Phaeosphaeria sp. MPI-PUGE-AT-0046c]|nr:mid region of cactin-domain-containing protein [Phaeosphaeria sp. MPI-PUGE-AT-0046c]
MASNNPPPWRNERNNLPQRTAPSATIPAKRSADSRAHDKPAKRQANGANSTNAAEDAWVADEDRFVLAQAKRKAALRVKGGRAKPIDWLAVTLRFVDATKATLDDEVEDHELEVVDPEGVLEGLDAADLSELEKEIEHYLTLETDRSNRDYWNALKSICKDLRRKSKASRDDARGSASVAADIDQLLAPKTYEQLETLEVQVKRKLDSDEPIDYDYWEQLLRSLRVWKAKAKLRRVSQEIITERLQALRTQQADAAASVQGKIYTMLLDADESRAEAPTAVVYDATLDPQPLLKLRAEDKGLTQTEEKTFLEHMANERRKIRKLGYVPMQSRPQERSAGGSIPLASQAVTTSASRFAPVEKEDYSQATMALYEREVARGVEEGEEIFTAEEDVATTRPQWAGSFKPRKPRYFNRVQMGYEWNKYNQTHYDHDNPPPKVVQGYKFNVFYPDLVDKAKAPTYKIERENGRKRGQSFAPAGEDDTCLIRFVAGPPYQDIAFRIIDKEWDYSAKRERGFKSSFDKGILQLHFQFKKVSCPLTWLDVIRLN